MLRASLSDLPVERPSDGLVPDGAPPVRRMNSASTTTLGHGSPPVFYADPRGGGGAHLPSLVALGHHRRRRGGCLLRRHLLPILPLPGRFGGGFAQRLGHTLLVPAISGYFVYLSRDKLLAVPFRPSLWGVAVLVLGILIYTACAFGPQAVQHHNLRGVGVGTAMLAC